jgi:hypothetical protein
VIHAPRNPIEERRQAVAAMGPLTPEDLKAIANGGIMDVARIYLPAGKLSEAEYRARERENLNP